MLYASLTQFVQVKFFGMVWKSKPFETTWMMLLMESGPTTVSRFLRVCVMQFVFPLRGTTGGTSKAIKEF